MPTTLDKDLQGARLLLVEDDPDIGKSLTSFFQKKGLKVTHAAEGEQAVSHMLADPPFDVVVLDVMLPKKNGFDVLKEARQAGIDTPVLILSARTQEKDKLRGFNLGADDYVTKPFSHEELAARIKVILRRFNASSKAPVEKYGFGDVKINFSNHTAKKGTIDLQFTALEFSILHYFIKHRGRTVSRKQLLRDVWNIEGDITTRTIDRHVASLRKKIEGDPTQPTYIQTVYGIGYKFTG